MDIEGTVVSRILLSTPLWLALGSIGAAGSVIPPLVTGNIGPLSPIPIHTLILLFTTMQGAILILPVLFSVQFLILQKCRHFLKIQVGFIVVLWVLTPIYFLVSWGYGVEWMGLGHTKLVFAEHIVGLSLLSVLVGVAAWKHSVAIGSLSNVLLFFFFFWGAFPVLGELP